MTFPLVELRALVARRATLPACETVAETARRAVAAGVTLSDLKEAELLHVCDAARIPIAARTGEAARAAIISARLSKFRFVEDTPAPSDSDAEDATSEAASSDSDASDAAPVLPPPPPPPAPLAAAKPVPRVPFDDSPAATQYWRTLEGRRDATTNVVIARAERIKNRAAYAKHRSEFMRGEYVAYDGGNLVIRCTDTIDLGARLLDAEKPLSPNYFWTVVGAEDVAAHGHARVSFCTVAWEASSGIVAELRPRLDRVQLVSSTKGRATVSFLIDTGSQVSILTKAVATQLSLNNQHPGAFRYIFAITGACTECPVYWLTATLTQLGDEPVIIPHPFVVAATDECILGMDFLHFFELRMRGHHPVTLRPLQRIVSQRADMGVQ